MTSGHWIENFGFSNLLYTWATHAITNHTLIEEYWLCFFYKEEFGYPYIEYPIKLRHHILYNCKKFTKG